jgi:hypothetical protein
MKKLIASLLILSCIVSCKKDKSSDEQDEKFPFYFSATINGAAVKYEGDDLNSTFQSGVSSPSFGLGDDVDIYEGTMILNPADWAKNVIYVHILKFFNHDPSFNERIAMFHLGDYPYGHGDISPSTINGASINFIDANGKEWTSEEGSQTGSTFTITEIADNPNSTSLKVFKASFSCKLYDENGASIEVKNAVIRGKILIP